MAHLVFSCKYLNLWIISLLFCQFILPWATDQSTSIPCLKCVSDSQAITAPLPCTQSHLKSSKGQVIIRYSFTCVLNYMRWYDLIYLQLSQEGFFLFFASHHTTLHVNRKLGRVTDQWRALFFGRMQYCVSQPRKWVVQFSVTQADVLQQDSWGELHYSCCWLEPVLHIGVDEGRK